VLDLCETLALDPPTQGVLALCRAQAKACSTTLFYCAGKQAFSDFSVPVQVEGLMKDLPSAHLGAPLLPKLDLQPQQIVRLHSHSFFWRCSSPLVRG